MTWAEFQIRLFAYNRIQKMEWLKLRELAWASLIGSHYDPKKLPKSKDSFMPLDNDKVKQQGITDIQKEAFLKATKQYLTIANNAKNRN
jgi:hypothetical protein